MNNARIRYAGATPGADSSSYVLFDTVASGLPAAAIASHGLSSYRLDIEHDQTGTIKLYKSGDRATWVQVGEQAATASATETTSLEWPIDAYRDFRVVWVNGGAEQTVWVVDQELCEGRASAFNAPPVVTVAAQASIDWGDTIVATVTATDPEGGAIGTVALLLDGVQVATRVGAGDLTYVMPWGATTGARSLTATAVDAAGLVGTSAAVSITVVDPLAAQNGTDWDYTGGDYSYADATCPAVSSWVVVNVPSVVGGQSDPVGGTGAYLLTASSDASPQYHTLTATLSGAAPGAFIDTFYVKKVGSQRYCFVAVDGSLGYVFLDLDTGAKGTTAAGLTATVTSVGSGWWKIDMWHANVPGLPRVGFANSLSNSSFQATGTEQLLVYHASGSVATKQRRLTQLAARQGPLGTLAQATVISQPFFWDGAGGVNNVSGVYYGSVSRMTRTFGSVLAQPFVVFSVQSITTPGTNFAFDGIDATNRATLFANAGNLYAFAGTQVSSGLAANTSKSIWVCKFNGASSFVRQNGVQSANISIGTAGLAGITEGSNYVGANALLGQKYGTGIIPGDLSVADIRRVERAIANKYGIALT